MSNTIRLALAACLSIALGACRAAGDRGFHVLDDFTEFPEDAILDDVIVWPVQQQGTDLKPDLLDRMTKRLHRGMRDQEYSVLSRSMIDHLAQQVGAGKDGALKVLEQTGADGVLVFRITRWDEGGLLNLGEIRAEGSLELLGPGGRVWWQRRVRCEDNLLPRIGGPRDLDARRRFVAGRIADLLASRLPRHRV